MAREYGSGGVADGPTVALFGGLGFSFGHGFTADPIVPWIGTTLKDPLLANAEKLERVRLLLDMFLAASIRHLDSKSQS